MSRAASHRSLPPMAQRRRGFDTLSETRRLNGRAAMWRTMRELLLMVLTEARCTAHASDTPAGGIMALEELTQCEWH